MKRVWDGMRLMSGYNSKSKSRSLPNSSENYANELNTFYNRFDCHDFSAERRDLRKILENYNDFGNGLSATEVRRLFSSLNPSEAADPVRLSPRLWKSCASQLAYIFTSIFNLSLTTRFIPFTWKHSCIIPVPKKPVISCLNDLRPVALTAVPMNILERLFLNYFRKIVLPFLDQCNFHISRGGVVKMLS